MAAPTPPCHHGTAIAALVHHGAIEQPPGPSAPCRALPAERVRFHILSAGMGVWLVYDTCRPHRDELAKLPHFSWSSPI